MEHSNHIKNQKIHYSTFTNNPITLQISSSKFQLRSKTRLSDHSSNETVFRHAAEVYEKELKKSGYYVNLQYKSTNQNSKNKIIRKISIACSNPPFSKSVSSTIDHYFLYLLDKHSSQKLIDFTEFSTKIMSKLAIGTPKT